MSEVSWGAMCGPYRNVKILSNFRLEKHLPAILPENKNAIHQIKRTNAA